MVDGKVSSLEITLKKITRVDASSFPTLSQNHAIGWGTQFFPHPVFIPGIICGCRVFQ